MQSVGVYIQPVCLSQGMDPYEFAEPVSVLGQLGKDFWDGLAAVKWTERRDALQKLRGLAATPKIAPGDYGDVLRELKKIITKDSNVVCVGEAIACLGNLANGLRSSFTASAKVRCSSALHFQHACGQFAHLKYEHGDLLCSSSSHEMSCCTSHAVVDFCFHQRLLLLFPLVKCWSLKDTQCSPCKYALRPITC